MRSDRRAIRPNHCARASHFSKQQSTAPTDDQQILALFDGLRVADVSDGMDQAGLADVGLVSAEIGPLWRDTKHFKHRIIGIAVTARYVPTNQPRHGALETDEFNRWMGDWYTNRSPEPFVPLLREGSVLVIEEAPLTDVGSIGSNNIMAWKVRGCVGVITSGTAATPTRSPPREFRCITASRAAASGRAATKSNRSIGRSSSAACW